MMPCVIYRSDKIQYLELFQAITMIDQNMNTSVNLSINSELMLEEPLFITYMIIFGVEGDCILEELMINASIDDIYGNDDACIYENRIYVATNLCITGKPTKL